MEAGYPDGLKGNEIPIMARIITVADAFDAITSDRSYRQRQDLETAYQEIMKCNESCFDPQIVQVFQKCWDKGEFQKIAAQWGLGDGISSELIAPE